MRRVSWLLLLALALPACTSAPNATKAAPGSDEFAIESTVLAVCNVISGPAGRRDWNRFKELFVPGGHIVSYRDGVASLLTPDEYATKMKPYYDANGFFDWPVATRVERFRDIAHVTSRYEVRRATTDAAPFERGVTHVELVRGGDRWLIASIVWQPE